MAGALLVGLCLLLAGATAEKHRDLKGMYMVTVTQDGFGKPTIETLELSDPRGATPWQKPLSENEAAARLMEATDDQPHSELAAAEAAVRAGAGQLRAAAGAAAHKASEDAAMIGEVLDAAFNDLQNQLSRAFESPRRGLAGPQLELFEEQQREERERPGRPGREQEPAPQRSGEDEPTLLLVGAGGVDSLAAAASLRDPAAARGAASGLGGWATSTFDSFLKETWSLLDALEAQQQRVVGAVLQQQIVAEAAAARAAGAVPRRPCPHHMAMMAGRAAAAQQQQERMMQQHMFGGEGAMVHMMVRGAPMTMTLRSGPARVRVEREEAAASSLDEPSAYEAAFEAGSDRGGDNSGADPSDLFSGDAPSHWQQLLLVLLSAACAGMFVGLVHALMQLRAAMADADGYMAWSEDGEDSDDGGLGPRRDGKITAYRPGMSRGSSLDDLEHPFLIDDEELACGMEFEDSEALALKKARVLVVLADSDVRGAAGVAHYRNQLYQTLPADADEAGSPRR